VSQDRKTVSTAELPEIEGKPPRLISGNDSQPSATREGLRVFEGRAPRLEIPVAVGELAEEAELFRRTFWSFGREFSSFWRQGALSKSDADPGHGSARLLVRPRGPLLQGVASRRTGRRVPVIGRRSAVDHAAASIDGHVPQAADRFASTRVRRAAAARAVRSAGTASPVPKYISSGVCPRNAECGSTRLCSWT
jgi:hypothetical protein